MVCQRWWSFDVRSCSKIFYFILFFCRLLAKGPSTRFTANKAAARFSHRLTGARRLRRRVIRLWRAGSSSGRRTTRGAPIKSVRPNPAGGAGHNQLTDVRSRRPPLRTAPSAVQLRCPGGGGVRVWRLHDDKGTGRPETVRTRSLTVNRINLTPTLSMHGFRQSRASRWKN